MRARGATQALIDRTVRPSGFDFDFVDVPKLIDGFRRMVRATEFDICEMAITTYVCARAHGKPFTALPIFPVRGFHHGAILVNRNAGISTPKDLEGRKVGVNRGYTVTTGVWARGILSAEYGVDLSKVSWVLSGDEHVAEYRPPANVVPVPAGQTIADMIVSGELAGAIGVEIDHPDVVPLIPDAIDTGFTQLRWHGDYPINHLIVVRDSLLDSVPTLAAGIFAAFVEAKRPYLDALRAGSIVGADATDRLNARVMDVLPDPLPYGIAPNRHVLEQLVQHAAEQGIIDAAMPVEALFAPATTGLAG